MVGTDRRDAILETSAQLFYDNGYPNVGMRVIADHVGIRTASLYHHFPSKEQILFEISVHETRGFNDAQAAILDSPLDPTERLRALFVNHIVHSWHHRVRLEVTHREERELTEEHRAVIAGHRTEYRKLIRDYLKPLSARRLPADELRVLVVSAASMLDSVNVWFDPDGLLTIEEVAQRIGTLAANIVLRTLDLPALPEPAAAPHSGQKTPSPAGRPGAAAPATGARTPTDP